MIFTVDGEVFPVNTGFQRTVHGLQEVCAKRLDMEPDQIGPQQSIHQLPLPRTNAERFRMRPRNMPENRDPRIGTLLLDHPGQQSKVIVLCQQQGILCPRHFLQHCISKLLVYLPVMLPVGVTEGRPHMGHVTQRPKPFIGETEVITFFFLLGQPDSPQRVTRIFWRNTQRILLIDRFLVRFAASMRDPGPIASPQNRLQCGYQTARRHHHLQNFSPPGVRIRFPVRNHE